MRLDRWITAAYLDPVNQAAAAARYSADPMESIWFDDFVRPAVLAGLCRVFSEEGCFARNISVRDRTTHTIGLAEARQRAQNCRKARLDGRDPIAERKAARLAAKLDAAKAMTFRACAERYIAAHKAGWKNAKHAAQWTATLAAYVYPSFGALPVQAVDVGLVLKAIEPIWTEKPEIASRVRGRIESILDWATARGYRTGESPARWRGHLENLLPSRSKVRRVEHHAALAYPEIAAFMGELRREEGIAAQALEFAILTAARTGEVIGARWDEINMAERLWTVPAERMKGGREHRVPLSDAALAIVEKMAAIRSGDFVFPGGRANRPLSNMAFLMLRRRMGRGELTAHGFRSSFRDWAAERTTFPADVAEMALAHAVSDKVEAAYRRGDLFQKRRQLADAWAKFCAAPPVPAPAGRVVAIRPPARRRGQMNSEISFCRLAPQTRRRLATHCCFCE